jgi:hypothetical protein
MKPECTTDILGETVNTSLSCIIYLINTFKPSQIMKVRKLNSASMGGDYSLTLGDIRLQIQDRSCVKYS